MAGHKTDELNRITAAGNAVTSKENVTTQCLSEKSSLSNSLKDFSTIVEDPRSRKESCEEDENISLSSLTDPLISQDGSRSQSAGPVRAAIRHLSGQAETISPLVAPPPRRQVGMIYNFCEVFCWLPQYCKLA